MDLADDVAYSVHDVEDGVVAGRVDLHPARPAGGVGDRARVVRPRRRRRRLDEVLAGLRTVGELADTPYDGSRRLLAALKNLTSDLIGRFCGAVQDATFAAGRRARSCGTPPTWSCPSRPGSRSRCSRGSPPTT